MRFNGFTRKVSPSDGGKPRQMPPTGCQGRSQGREFSAVHQVGQEGKIPKTACHMWLFPGTMNRVFGESGVEIASSENPCVVLANEHVVLEQNHSPWEVKMNPNEWGPSARISSCIRLASPGGDPGSPWIFLSVPLS